MVFGDIQAAGAEQDGEQGEDQRDHQRRVLHPRARGIGTGADQQVDAEHDTFQL
ncbi:hypothetical protein D3C76_436370 [compost metagenome]